MADFLLHHILSLITVFSLTFPATGALSDSIQTTPFKLGTEKLSHFMFYWHDIHSGSKPTSIKILKPLAKNVSLVTGFGTLSMIDDPLTENPENDSKMIGRAQGFYGMASQEEVGLIMVMNFMFVMGRYNGSTLTVVGRNPVFQKVREMPVIGGTGLFRFARGYVQARTHTLNMQTGDAIVEYDVYVLHY